jgi:two-component system, response regulator FlrC
MSTPFVSEQLGSFRPSAQSSVESAEQADQTRALLDVEDLDAASRSAARLLISASTQQAVETLAWRIHGNGPRGRFPFIMADGGEFPVGAQALKEHCVRWLDAAAGGSVLITSVEEMPATVQEALIDLLAGLQSARRRSAAVRLMSGTTVSLLDRVAAGTFSERLFYRLNIIHLIVGNGSRAGALI